MSSVKNLLPVFFVFLVVFAAAPARADIEEFKVSSAQLGAEDQNDSASMLTKLKHAAIHNFLGRLGIDRDRLEKVITPEFADQYIIDYKVSRKGGVSELSGHLDADSLRRWARLAETKTRGGEIRPALVVSSEVPGLPFAPKDTAARAKDSVSVKEILTHLNSALGKLNARLTPLDAPAFTLTQPARTPEEVRALQAAAGNQNGAVWAHFTPNKPSGTQLDLYYYVFAQGRATIVKSEDLSLEGRDLANARTVAKAFNIPLREFAAELTERVSRGTLQSGAHRLIVEGIDSFRGFKQLDTSLGRLDYVAQATLKRSETNLAEFELLSTLSTPDLSQRLTANSYPGFQLKAVRVEPQTIVVRFTK